MKHFIPLIVALSFSVWTIALLLYQKRTILYLLRSASTRTWILQEISSLIDRIIPDLAMPFIPGSLLTKLKTHGSDEAIKRLPKAEALLTHYFKKYLLPLALISFIVGLAIGLVIFWFL